MCGICGIMGFGPAADFDESLLERMCESLRHRGPDERGARVEDFGARDHPARVGIANTRLSIIDLGGGHQPMPNEDQTVWVVNNGEIYNFAELRDGLLKRGHTFRTRSDTEVLVHLYEEKGEALLHDLRGMFAMAIWDGRRQRLFLARDRLGKKPLCYFHDGDRFVFGSEIKAILQAPGVPRKVDTEALFHYLTYQYVPHPWTMFAGIRKLPPAHFMTVDRAGCRIEEYWRPPFGETSKASAKQLAGELRELLFEATKYRLISDVPLGAFLSGGIDSSIVVGIMSQLSKEPVKTFTISFEEKRYDEAEYAREIAELYHTDHREFTVRPDAVEVIPKLVWHYDEPFADSSAIPTYYVSKATAEHVKVALTGDAGDECFCGYHRYKAVKLAAYFDGLPGPVRRIIGRGIAPRLPTSIGVRTFRRRLRRFLDATALDPVERYVRWIGIFDDERKAALCSPEFLARFGGRSSVEILAQEYRECPAKDFVGCTSFVDMRRYLPDDLLVKTDIASMANSLEARSPFLDHKVVEFASRVPTDLKLRGMTSKYLLKRAFADMLPRRIRTRSKMGFGVPIADWFRRELRGYLEDAILSPRAIQRGYFRPDYIRQLVREHVEGKWDHGYRLWSLLMLELWHRAFIDSAKPPERPA